jgi:small conductance mechanosensitive channel
MIDYARQFSPLLWAAATSVGMGLLILAASWMLGSLAYRLIERVASRAGPSREDVLQLLAQIARTAVMTFGIVTALGTMGVNVSALVAGLGLTGFALGFAFRDALSNLLAGAMILFYRPFRRHDRIKVAEFEGTVAEINLRYTIIRREGSRVLIPNSNLLTNPIIVLDVAAAVNSTESPAEI